MKFIDTESLVLDEKTLDRPPETPNLIWLHAPEIGAKGRNKRAFQAVLIRNLRHRLRVLGGDWEVRATGSRATVAPVDASVSLDDALNALERLPGIEELAAVFWLPPGLTGQRHGFPDWTLVEDAAVRAATEAYEPEAAFAVSVKRVDKGLFLKSPEIGRRLGAAIVERTPWKKVNLTTPDCVVQVDILKDGIYVRAARSKGVGGLPVGSSGRVLSLLSQGVASPVASFLMARRGCCLDHIHLTSGLHGAEDPADTAVARMVQQLSRYVLETRLFFVSCARVRDALADSDTGHEAMLARRFAMRVAEALAKRIGARGLVSGDCLGQSGLETLENLGNLAGRVALPIFQPLIAYDSREIGALARRLDLVTHSGESRGRGRAGVRRRPRTRSRADELSRLEATLMPNYDAIVDFAVRDAVCLAYDCGALVAIRQGQALFDRPSHDGGRRD